MKKIFAYMAIMSVVAPALAFSAEKEDQIKTAAAVQFKEWDANGDQYVSQQEFVAAKVKQSMQYDVNHDNKLSLQELTTQRITENIGMGKGIAAEQTQEQLRITDTDGDGFVSAAEQQVRQAAAFPGYDRNGDQYISQEELTTARIQFGY